MRMLGSGLATSLEEMARKNDGMISGCLNILLHSTLADRLWSPWITIAFAPAAAAAGLLAFYTVFLVLFLPMYLLSFLLTSYGSVAFFLFLVLVVARSLARSLAFAGSTMSVQREMSADFMKRLLSQLENVAKMTTSLTSTLMLIGSGRVARMDIPSLSKKIEEVHNLSEILPILSRWIDASLKEYSMKSSNGADLVTKQEAEIMTQLKKAIDVLSLNFTDLYPVAKQIIINCSNSSHNRLNISVLNSGSANLSSLVLLAGKCLKASEYLKESAVAARTSGLQGGDEEGFMWVVRQVLKLNQGPVGASKYSFSIMRQQIKSKFQTERITVVGKDGNLIDSVLVPCRESYDKLVEKEEENKLEVKKRKEGCYVENDNDGNSSNKGSDRNGKKTSFSPLISASSLSNGTPKILQKSSSKPNAFSTSTLGTVLFCSPNAGLYECLSQASKESSWVGYYTSLGFDVCLFNYRGYSRSTGTPSPDGCKSDACTLAQYLRTKRGVNKLIVHGESIGGMVACHVAHVENADMLICDRTFASLDAVAARLLGQWAGIGLRLLVRWKTNVVADYLLCKCPKVILQDPNDEIIANASSLKNGISTSMILGDNVWSTRSFPREYLTSGFLNAPVPNQDKCASLLKNAENVEIPLKEDFVVHLSACITKISVRASQSKSNFFQKKKLNNSNSYLQGDDSNNNSDDNGNKKRKKSLTGTMRSIQSGGNRINSSNNNDSITSPSSSVKLSDITSNESAAWKASQNEEGLKIERQRTRRSLHQHNIDINRSNIAVNEDSESKNNHGSLSDDDDDEDEDDDDDEHGEHRDYCNNNNTDTESASGSGPGSTRQYDDDFSDYGDQSPDDLEDGVGGDQEGNNEMTPEDRLEAFCLMNFRDSSIDPWTKVWTVIARCDGGSGQLLGQAALTGLDGIRSWICALILFSTRAALDCKIPSGAVSIHQSTADLAVLVDSLHSRELSNEPSIQFIRCAFAVLIKRLSSCSMSVKGNPSLQGSRKNYMSTENKNIKKSIKNNSNNSKFSNGDKIQSKCNVGDQVKSDVRTYADCGRIISSSEAGTSMLLTGVRVSEASGDPPVCMSGEDIGVGHVIALHNGHNGWPSESELSSLKDLIISAGFLPALDV